MATTISCGFPWLNDGATFNGLLTRTTSVAAQILSTGSSSTVAARSGVLPAAGAEPMLVAASTGMGVTVNPGYAVIQSATSATQGAYRMGLMSQGTVTLNSSDVTNPRIDLVVAQVVDNGDPTSVSQIAVITGTPAPSPSVPSTTGLHVTVLAQIAVGANVSSIVAANITDKRQFTTHPSGVLIVTSQAQRDAITAPHDGMKIYRRDTGNEEIWKKTSNAWVVSGSVTDSGWLNFTFSNTLANSGSPGYRKIQVGPQPRVQLRGTLKANLGLIGQLDFTVAGGMVIAVLPSGARPTFDQYFTVATSSVPSQPSARLQINAANGQVLAAGPQSSPTWVSLDGVDFEQGN